MPRYEIVARTDFSEVTFLLEVLHPLMAQAARPGQYVIVTEHENGERIPLTIADFDHDKGTITLVIPAQAQAAREMQRRCRVGTQLHAMVGPLGIPSHIFPAKKVLCVGGGLGVSQVFAPARAYKDKRVHVVGVIGFRSRDLMFWHDRFEACCEELAVYTDDGSAGIAGRAADGLREAIDAHPDVDVVVVSGSPEMMQRCAEATRPHGIRTIASLNPVLVDDNGMCGGCRVRVGDQTKFTCVSGPDFDAHRIDFDDLVARVGRTRSPASRALAGAQWSCRIRGSAEAVAPLPPHPRPH